MKKRAKIDRVYLAAQDLGCIGWPIEIKKGELVKVVGRFEPGTVEIETIEPHRCSFNRKLHTHHFTVGDEVGDELGYDLKDLPR
jgi:hypothetical protein